MSGPVKIRKAGPADAPAILELEAHFPSDRLSDRAIRRFLRSPSAQVFVAVLERKVLANLILLSRRGARVARIYSVVVDPRLRGRGLGLRLLQRAEAAARAAGCHAMSLELRLDNAAALRFYTGAGYAQTARLPRYYDDAADGLRLRKLLGPEALSR